MKQKIIMLISTKIFKKVLFAVMGVLVARTDNEIDNEILNAVKSCFE